MDKEKLMDKAREVIEEKDVEVVISQIEFASNTKFSEADKKLFKLAYRHGFAGGLAYVEKNLSDFMYG